VLLHRGSLLLGSVLLLAGLLLAVFQPLSSLMRNQRELRYLVTPANVLWSAGAVVAADLRGAARPREAIGLDATAGPSWALRSKPLVLVLVVGETARAANWGLSGYARQTTPQLAALPVLNFPQASGCGTNTEVSLPCMFAPVGRRSYDETRIRGQQSLLHVLARAGAAVHWRDNQSGCKGVCEDLPADTVSALVAPGLCSGEHCQDEGLVRDLDQRLARLRGTRGVQVWVLHMLGSHGPAYHRRYPPAFARFQPACAHDELRLCSAQEIANAYDNTLLYTDHVLASAIAKLQAAAGSVDSALLYASDHGESLGEMGLFLHGLPWPIAPDVQKRVPMVFWASAGFEQGAGFDPGCLQPQLQRSAAGPVSHDHLFHTVLGLLDVHTALHEPALDLVNGCRARASGVP
jgi:lipid A ethanolaminephosphotransferase